MSTTSAEVTPDEPQKRGVGQPRRTDTTGVQMRVPNQFRDYVRELAAELGITQIDTVLYHLLPQLDPARVPGYVEPTPAPAEPTAADEGSDDDDDIFM